jgi:predicted AAA+ superfamily ATPase
VIDEVQKAPQVLTLVKNLVDSDKNRRFVLSGSANLLPLKEVTETLAGRSLYFPLLPFSRQEWEGKSFPPSFCSSLKEFRPKFWKA